MSTRPAAAVLAALLVLSLLSGGGAAAAPHDQRDPQQTSTTPAQASAALDRARQLFAPEGPAVTRRSADARIDATMVLNTLMRVYGDLSPTDQRRADRLFARPTDGPEDPELDGYTVPEAPAVCGDTVCVHHVDTTEDAATDEYVQRALALAEQVNDTYVRAGYRRPDPDGTLGGGTDLVDVYLKDLGPGLRGYCTSDEPRAGAPQNRWAYCVVDNDFASSDYESGTPLENLQVTLAHEYFHAVQYAYDAFEDPWILEATATWAEDQVFDAVNDNRRYLQLGQLGSSRLPLDLAGDRNHHGNWVFFQYLGERWDESAGGMPLVVLEMWQRMSGRDGAPDEYSTQAIERVLADRGVGFPTVYRQFVEALQRPSASFEEGGAPEYEPATEEVILREPHRPEFRTYVPLQHLTHHVSRYVPADRLREQDWQLLLKVHVPDREADTAARVRTHLRSGRIVSTPIRPSERRWSRVVTPFSARKVRYVELVLLNATLSTTCWVDESSPYACLGDPDGDDVRFKYQHGLSRR